MKDFSNNNNFCIILCGGVGNRLWPYSRTRKPKQFLDLLNLGMSMLQLTFERVSHLLPKENIFVARLVLLLPLPWLVCSSMRLTPRQTSLSPLPTS